MTLFQFKVLMMSSNLCVHLIVVTVFTS